MNTLDKDGWLLLKIIILVVFFSVWLYSGYIYHQQRLRLITNAKTQLQHELELLSLMLAAVPVNDHDIAAKQFLRWWAHEHGNIMLEAIFATGQVLFAYHNQQITHHEYQVTKRINYQNQPLNLTLAHAPTIITEKLNTTLFELLTLGVIFTIAIVFALWLLLLRQVIKPIRLQALRQTQVLRDTIAYAEGLFNAMNAHKAILDSNDIIMSTNVAWQEFARANGHRDDPAMIGQPYIAAAIAIYQVPQHAEAWKNGITNVTLGLATQYSCEYCCLDQGKQRWFIMRASPVPASNPPIVIATHEDITSIKESQLALVESEGQLRQINRVYQALSASNMLLSKAKQERDLIQGVADIIYNNCNRLVWIGCIVDQTTQDIQEVAYTSIQENYARNKINFNWCIHNHQCDTATCTEKLRCNPLNLCIQQQSPIIAPWPSADLSPNSYICAAFPLVHDQTCLGAVAIYARHDDVFSTQEINLFNELAANLAFGIFAIRDRHAKEKALFALDLLSTTDKLTQLYNRTKLDEVLETETKRSTRYVGMPLAIVLVDLDHFKLINDTYGHQAGDRTLVEFAQIMRNNVRDSDVAGRWGGEEFLIICPNTDACGACCLAEKLRHILEQHEIAMVGAITASFGVAEFTVGDNVDSMLGRADKALYAAKDMGRNRVVNQC